MKKIRWALLCLLIAGCGSHSSSDSSPAVCLEYGLILPGQTVYASGFQAQKRYQLQIDGMILWDDCTRTSQFVSIASSFSPSSNPIISTATFQGFINPLLNDNVHVQIYELSTACGIVAPAIWDQQVSVDSIQRQSGDGACSYAYQQRSIQISF